MPFVARTEPVTIFVCGRKDATACTEPGCVGRKIAGCAFPLGGRKEGQTCGRALCPPCAAARGGNCGPHHRLIESRKK